MKRAKKLVGRRFIVPVVVDADYQGDPNRYENLIDEFPTSRRSTSVARPAASRT